jgi:DNA-directed RNA polymerase subunit RPC12/RpoP
MVAVSIGFIGVAGLVALALWIHSAWFVVLSFFILMNCWGGLKQARALSRLAKLPRREGFACPCCKTAPPIGAFWKCAQCGQPFDTFQTQAVCPKCNARFTVTGCLDCRRAYSMSEWMAPSLVTSAS